MRAALTELGLDQAQVDTALTPTALQPASLDGDDGGLDGLAMVTGVLAATPYALAGSLVSRQEDANAAAMPISATPIGAYILVFVLGGDPSPPPARCCR